MDDAVYAFILAPIAVILVASLTAADYTAFPPGMSLRWYAEIPASPGVPRGPVGEPDGGGGQRDARDHLGTLAALALVRYRFRGRAPSTRFFLSPLMLPTVILGLALLQFYALVGITRTPASLVCGHLVITVPYVIRLVGAGLAGLDPSLERAAMSLGATPWRTFRAVTLPLIAPGRRGGRRLRRHRVVRRREHRALPGEPARAHLARPHLHLYRADLRSARHRGVLGADPLRPLAAIMVVERGIGLGRLFFGTDGS